MSSEPLESAVPTFAERVRKALHGKHVCPFCAAVNNDPEKPCQRCTMENSPVTRQATQLRIGPWYVMQTRNPSAPGMRFATLLSLVKKGQITPRSIVRGPTTHQLWRFAAQVRGLSREFGLCFHCGVEIDKSATQCDHCHKSQEPPVNPDVLLESKGAAIRTSVGTPVMKEVAEPGDIVLSPRPSNGQPIEATQRQLEDASNPAPSAGPFSTTGATVKPTTPVTSPAPQPDAPPPEQKPSNPTVNLRRKEPVRLIGDGGILSAHELATAFQKDYQPRARRRVLRKLLMVTAVLLFASAAAFAAALYVNPPLRDQSLVWSQAKYEQSKAFVLETFKQGPVDPTAGAPVAKPQPAPEQVNQPARVVAPPLTIMPPPRPQTTPPAAAVEAPSTQPVVSVVAVNPPPAPRESAVVREPPVAAPSNTARPTNEMYEQVRAHWRNALDAEANQDFPEAIHHYEQIRKMPRSIWPANLELRLDQARKQVQ